MTRTLLAVAVTAATLIGVLVAFLVLVAGTTSATAGTGMLGGSLCATSGPIKSLTDASAANARAVAATASHRGGHKAALVALMVGMAESNLRVLGNPHDPSGDRLPNQGVGYDHDSLGIFQQRPGWGSAVQRMDPVASTNLFIDRLLSIAGWRSEPPWLLAQQVQRSAVSDGSNYRAQLPEAQRVLHAIEADSVALDCGGSDVGAPPRGPLGRYGLPKSYGIPAEASNRERMAITFALQQLGKPYVFGAEGPDSYDCSGLTQSSWAAAGVGISRVTTTQQYDGRPTSPTRLSPGDLILTPGADGTLASPGHVGMFIGRGLVVHAPQPGEAVEVVTYRSFTAGGISALRHINPATSTSGSPG